MSDDQRWEAERYARDAGFVAELGLPVVDWLAPRRGERILDLGCGDGRLTARLAALGCEVVGVDASADQVRAARARGLDARHLDARTLPFEREFDAVFTNAALHWIPEPDPVIAGVRRALRPEGRFVGEFGGEGNVAAVVAALTDALARRGLDAAALNPWYFPPPDSFRKLLERHGLVVERLEHFARPTPLDGPLIPWLELFTGAFTAPLTPPERGELLAGVRDALRGHLFDGERWVVDYVRLRFAARVAPAR